MFIISLESDRVLFHMAEINATWRFFTHLGSFCFINSLPLEQHEDRYIAHETIRNTSQSQLLGISHSHFTETRIILNFKTGMQFKGLKKGYVTLLPANLMACKNVQ